MADVTKIDTFIQSSPHPAWLATAQGHCVYANPALERLTGFYSDQIIQADWRSFLLEEDRAVASASWQRSLATGAPYRVQVLMRGSDGVPERVELIAFGHHAGDEPELWLFSAIGVNGVAAQKRPERGPQLQATLNVIPAYTWYALPSGALTFVNERTANYLGLPKDHPLRFGIDTGAAWDSHIPLLHPDDREEARRIWSICLQTGSVRESNIRIRNGEGGYRWFLTRVEPLRANDGTLLYWIGVNLDIEDRKRAEQERERLRQLEAALAHINRVNTLGEMAASLAHEIKQPIAAAITSANSCLQWLAHEPPNLGRARAAAARIDKYGNRAAEIIDRIRSFYRKSPPQRELVDVNGIIQEILTLLDSEATRSSVAVRTELASELPEIMVDRVQLQQVFMNLMLNAIEAMKNSGGELTVQSELQDGQLQFSVSDTGVGLPREKMDQIFSAFFSTKPQGSGMGLAISRSIVESHGGRLWASANSGRGAAFHFTLPTEITEPTTLVSSTGPDASRMI